MIAVSDAWKAAHNETLLPETFISLSYGITEPGLSNDATATGSNEEHFSEANKIVSLLTNNPERYVSLERNAWGLDGSILCGDGSPDDSGYTTTTLSGENTGYAVVPTITVLFSKVHSALIPGVTLTWSTAMNEWASSFRITAYNGTTQVAQKTVTENVDVVSQVWVDIQNYNKIVVEVLEWSHPYHRCRVEKLFLGIVEVYTKRDLLGYDHTESVDVLSATLPKNEITFRLDNSTGRWNPNNPSGAERYSREQQQIDVMYGMRVADGVEWIKAGTFWLSEWGAPANGMEANFTAKSAASLMNDVYRGPRTGTLLEIAEAAFAQAALPPILDGSARYVLDASLSSQQTDFTGDDKDYTIAEVLQMVAHMACCVFYQDRDGRVRIEHRSTGQTDYTIGRFNSYAHPEFEISKPIKAVSVDYGDEQTEIVEAGAAGEVQAITNPLICSKEDARKVANAAISVLESRKTISGEHRADPRLCALDEVVVESKYNENVVVITEIKYSTTGGAMKGTYSGRVMR